MRRSLSILTMGLLACSSEAGILPTELPLNGRARGIVDLQGKCLNSQYMKKTSALPGGGCPEYIRGVQLSIEWADAEPRLGVYNFSAIERGLQHLSSLGKYAVIKLTGGHKPAWMYDQIPQNRAVWSSENFDNTTLMYWHPLFISTYLKLIAAYADFVVKMDQKYGGVVAFVRMNYNAVGTEHIGIPGDSPARNMETWFAPAGCKSNCSAVHLPWSSEEDLSYRQQVLDEHVATFSPLRKLLLRANIYGEEDLNITGVTHGVKAAALGFFQTGAAMEEDQVFNQVWRYSAFQKWCLPGITYGFAEQAGFWQYTAKWPQEPTNPFIGLFSKIQFAYWLMLSNMNSGVAASGIHFDPMMLSSRADDVDRAPLNDTRYIQAYQFFDKYGGFHAHPAESPGAWVAFRGRGDNYPAGDYSFLMSANASATFNIGITRLGSNKSAFGAWCKALPPGESVVIQTRLTDSKGAPLSTFEARVVWYDGAPDNTITAPRGGNGSWRLEFDSSGGAVTAMEGKLTGSGAWVETVANITGCTSSTLRLVNTAKVDAAATLREASVAFHMVEVMRL